ncbi:LOW QUALITY PROTEIN: cytochrome P450 3A19-like, partial [Spinachia spinachia]
RLKFCAAERRSRLLGTPPRDASSGRLLGTPPRDASSGRLLGTPPRDTSSGHSSLQNAPTSTAAGHLPFFSVETWILPITFICIFVIYGNWTGGIFENLGIPGPKPPYWGTVGRYHKPRRAEQGRSLTYGRTNGSTPTVLTPRFLSLPVHASGLTCTGLTDHEILTQATMFMVAGYETTLAFLAYNLARNPEVMKRLQEEIDATFPNKGAVRHEELLQMEHLDGVVNESRRLYPPAGRLGIRIPKDMIIAIPVYALHRDPDLWPEPEEFKPDGFSKRNRRSIDPYAYLPFGRGPRNRLGLRFALVLVQLALVEVLQNYSFSVCEETQIPLTMDPAGLAGPVNPIKLTVATR